MIVKRKSLCSGIEREIDLPITRAQMDAFSDGVLVQDAFPHLTNEQREFILTGITPDEWSYAVVTGGD